jgi:hypothetical protein
MFRTKEKLYLVLLKREAWRKSLDIVLGLGGGVVGCRYRRAGGLAVVEKNNQVLYV